MWRDKSRGYNRVKAVDTSDWGAINRAATIGVTWRDKSRGYNLGDVAR
jgi:hypothetical protein